MATRGGREVKARRRKCAHLRVMVRVRAQGCPPLGFSLRLSAAPLAGGLHKGLRPPALGTCQGSGSEACKTERAKFFFFVSTQRQIWTGGLGSEELWEEFCAMNVGGLPACLLGSERRQGENVAQSHFT